MVEEKVLIEEIIQVGKRLYQAGLCVAKSGNLSARLSEEEILITATGTFLGDLKPDDIVKVKLSSNEVLGAKKPSSELPLHSLIYKNFPAQTIIHCHPPLINGYFAVCNSLKALTFETKFYLGEVPVIPQETPTVTNPEPVIAALKGNNQVVLKNHGTVTVADKFSDGLSLIEALEEAVRVAAVARLFEKSVLDDLDVNLKDSLTRNEDSFPMFSREHIQAIVDLVNKDEFIAQKGKELDLTVSLAVKLDGTDKAYKFVFEKGRIIKLENNSDAPFVISAPAPVWEQVFLGKLDSFVAVTQGKMKLQGQLGQLSKWYVPFTRLFSLFKEVKIR
ncbi:MAG: class II aldolase/adducin family protein [Candidatus Omnitrophica bacterium]|nr:class II aldolase/adducin family protein [Candidatus Omnitrophota bacterium]MDD5652546.1 class II aldolase/adducin family protein [Candidatus Omnitrophota bacterium]